MTTIGYLYADYYDDKNNSQSRPQPLEISKIHTPTDHWSRGDRAMLGTALAVAALLTAAGTLGILRYLGHNVGPFNVLVSKLGIKPCALAVFGGGALALASVAVATTKRVQDKRAVKKLIQLMTTEPQSYRDATAPSLIQLRTILSNGDGYTCGKLGQYHAIYTNGNLYLFATSHAALKASQQLNSEYELTPHFLPTKITDHNPNTNSVMGKKVKYFIIETQENEITKQNLIEGQVKSISVIEKVKASVEKEAKLEDQVPKGRLRVALGATLLAASIAAIVVPIFFRFKMGNAVQMFGIGSATILLYGTASGILLKMRSEEFVEKGHDPHYRKVSSGVSYGLMRHALYALIIGGLLAAAATTTHNFSIKPLYIAPPLAAGAVATLAYSHFKGRENERRWDDRRDLNKQYENGADPISYNEPDSCTSFKGSRYVLSSHIFDKNKRLIIDLKDIKNRPAFEGAKRQFNLSNSLLPILAVVLLVAVVGTRVFLWRFPKPLI